MLKNKKLTLDSDKFDRLKELLTMDLTAFASTACKATLNRFAILDCPTNTARTQTSSCSMDQPFHPLQSALEPSSWTNEFAHQCDP